VVQADDQERQAAAAAAEEAASAAANAQADQVELQRIDAQIAAAKAEGDAAAVAALEPKQSAVLGNLTQQSYAGLGQAPEVPTVFLNIAS
jgi:Spy/CpxP family protein refolding chaperone